MGSTNFTGNSAYWGGAIYTDDGDVEDDEPASTTTLPVDTVFEGNSAEVSALMFRTSPLALEPNPHSAGDRSFRYRYMGDQRGRLWLVEHQLEPLGGWIE